MDYKVFSFTLLGEKPCTWKKRGYVNRLLQYLDKDTEEVLLIGTAPAWLLALFIKTLRGRVRRLNYYHSSIGEIKIFSDGEN
jgi:hypothetical protein